MKRLPFIFLFLALVARANDVGEQPWLSIQPWWIPMCFLVDPELSEKSVNDRIDKIVTEYAACGINVRPFTFTLSPDYPTDVETLRAAALTACPLDTEFGVRGAIQIETRHASLSAQMCDDPEAQGCSTQCEPVSLSIVGPEAKPTVALRESMRGNCCGPLCVDEGQGNGRRAGVGLELTTYSLETPHKTIVPVGKSGISYEIHPQGCHALREGATNNAVTQWYQKRPASHYAKAAARERYVLTGGKSFFEKGAVRSAKDVRPDPTPLKNTVVQTGTVNKLMRNLSSERAK